MACASLGVLKPSASTTIVLSHIYLFFIIIYFPTPKDPSIFGLHTQRWCNKVCLVSDYVACIFIYVPLHGLGAYNIFVTKSALCAQRDLSASLMSQLQHTSLRQHTLATRQV